MCGYFLLIILLSQLTFLVALHAMWLLFHLIMSCYLFPLVYYYSVVSSAVVWERIHYLAHCRIQCSSFCFGVVLLRSKFLGYAQQLSVKLMNMIQGWDFGVLWEQFRVECILDTLYVELPPSGFVLLPPLLTICKLCLL